MTHPGAFSPKRPFCHRATAWQLSWHRRILPVLEQGQEVCPTLCWDSLAPSPQTTRGLS